MPTYTPDLWDAAWLPRSPYATDNLEHGLRRGSRTRARTLRYVEASPKALQSLLIVDLDHEDALMKSFWKPSAHPEPSWVSINPANGHGHVGWVLKTPLVKTDSARLAPMQFAARVETGLRDALGGDIGYSGLITKNPLHDHWETFWGPERAYSLTELATGLGDLFPKSLPSRVADNSGLGRNCALFNSVRLWAYSAISRYWGETAEEWEQIAFSYALAVNQEFNVPMSYAEVKHLARSVARWTRRNITEDQTKANRSSWGKFLQSKSVEPRAANQAAKRLARAQQALEIQP